MLSQRHRNQLVLGFPARWKAIRIALKSRLHGLNVLKTRNNGYRNLQTVTLGQAGGYLTTTSFRFDGKRYQKYRESTQEQH